MPRLFLSAALLEGANLELTLRSRVEPFKGSGEWQEVQIKQTLPVHQTAILICDMWDKHWCAGATQRVDALAPKMAPAGRPGARARACRSSTLLRT